MSRTRRNFSAKFKSELVIELFKGEKDLNTIATENNIQPNLLRNWKKEFLDKASVVFDDTREDNLKEKLALERKEKAEYAKKVGQLTMQVDWLKKNLKKHLDLTTRVNLVQNLLKTKELPVKTGAALLDINRTSVYYNGTPISQEELDCKSIIDRLHTDNPTWGARQLSAQLEKRGLNFVRYADDCIIMVGSEMSANRVMRNISRFIEKKLGFKVNMSKSKVDKPQGLKYLGFGFYFDSRAHQFKAKPHAKSVAKFKKRMKEFTCRSWGVSNSYKVEKLNQLIRGWINYFKIGNMKTLCKQLDSNIRYRLRMCIWKQWKTPQNRAKNLIKLGINKYTAWKVAYAGDRIAYVCNKSAVNVAISNERLTRFGLVSMMDYYTERCITC